MKTAAVILSFGLLANSTQSYAAPPERAGVIVSYCSSADPIRRCKIEAMGSLPNGVALLPVTQKDCQKFAVEEVKHELRIIGSGVDMILRPGEAVKLQYRGGKWEPASPACDGR